jgi:hypothetical protein
VVTGYPARVLKERLEVGTADSDDGTSGTDGYGEDLA